LPVWLSFGYHIPDNDGQLSGCGSDGCVSAFSVSDPFKERREGMLFLISYAVCCLFAFE
jgi:hypothetical protein